MHLERITLICEVVGQMGTATVAEVCARTDLPKATAYRLVQDLVGAGLLEPAGAGRFAIGSRLLRIGRPDQSDRALIDRITPALRQAAERHGAAFFLSRMRGRDVEIIHVETPDSGVSFLHPGLGKRPLHACSCAKAVAAFCPDLMASLDVAGRLKAYTEFTITRIADLDAEFSKIRRQGYAECVEELERGMCSVAAPLGRTGPWATLSIGATASVRVFPTDIRADVGQYLTRLAAHLTSDAAGPDPRSGAGSVPQPVTRSSPRP